CGDGVLPQETAEPAGCAGAVSDRGGAVRAGRLYERAVARQRSARGAQAGSRGEVAWVYRAARGSAAEGESAHDGRDVREGPATRRGHDDGSAGFAVQGAGP